MKNILLLLLFPLMMFAQDSPLIGDVDCDGEITSQDASLILQFVTGVIDELPCQDNMTGLTPEQLQEIINMMDEQLSINYAGGGVGSGMPTMITEVSEEEMSFALAMSYCRNLEENGYTDWFLPTTEQLLYAGSGGVEFPDQVPLDDEALWTTSVTIDDWDHVYVVRLTYGAQNDGTSLMMGQTSYNTSRFCRCVRFGEGETSEGSGGLSNSSGSSILGNSEQPITMIGPMYITDEFEFTSVYQLNQNSTNNAMYYFDAVRFCAELEYNGFNDWFLPSLNQLHSYYENNTSIGIVIPNFTSGEEAFWTRINNSNIGSTIYNVRIKSSDSSLPNQMSYVEDVVASSLKYCFCVR